VNSTKCCNLYIFAFSIYDRCYSAPIVEWSIVMSVIVYLYVCSQAYLWKHTSKPRHIFCMLSTVVLRSSFGGVAIYYVLPVYGWRYFPHNGSYGDLSIPCQCRRCMILRWLTPLLLVNDCVLSYTTAGETARRIHRTKGAGGVVCDVSLPS